MFEFQTDDLGRDYRLLVERVRDEGVKTSPRGMPTYEVENAVIHLTEPRNSLPVGWGRKFSRGILSAELMQWLSGTSDLKQLNAVSKGRFLNYSDDGVRLYGAYGPRAYSTLERAVRILSEDPDSRQAIAVLWSDTEVFKTADLPCTLSWGFRVRDGGLHMSTTMRSSDVWRGITYDITCMTRIGSAVAWALGLELTDYFHTAYSLHAYESDLEAIDTLTEGGDSLGQPPMLSDFLTDDLEKFGITDIVNGLPFERWMYVRDVLAIEAMNGEDEMPMSFEWFTTALRAVPRYRNFCSSCRYWLPSNLSSYAHECTEA
jgi:thymidylate synthase